MPSIRAPPKQAASNSNHGLPAETLPETVPVSARAGLGFWSLVVTQFQGAFNDNALKFLVIYIIVDMSLPQRERDWLILVVERAFRPTVYPVFDDRRFSRRSFQQALGHHWHEVDGSCRDVVFASGAGTRQPGDGIRRRISA